MPGDESEGPFDSIESAHEFVGVLAQMVLDAMKDLNTERQDAVRNSEKRRTEAIDIAQYKLKMLCCHLHKSRRILNDLRTLRRLILNERSAAAPERQVAA